MGTVTTSNILELIHELDINRIELEIQNEELQQAKHELTKLHEEYKNLYEFAPCGYITLNSEGIITHINLTGIRLIAVERKTALHSALGSFIEPPYKDPS